MSDAGADIARLRRKIVEMACIAKEGHVPSCLSVLDILYVLYTKILGPNDHAVLSKGHSAAALYAVLAHVGVIPSGLLDSFCQPGSPLQGHPERGTPGVEFSSGSLGHGICGAVGMAYAKKVKSEPGRVFCLVGDGELQEGSCWEAMRLAYDLGLSNLSIIVDMNEPDRRRNARRAMAFCVPPVWEGDGHDHESLKLAFGTRHSLYLLNTVKGKGIPEMEADPRAWHHRTIGLREIWGNMVQDGWVRSK